VLHPDSRTATSLRSVFSMYPLITELTGSIPNNSWTYQVNVVQMDAG